MSFRGKLGLTLVAASLLAQGLLCSGLSAQEGNPQAGKKQAEGGKSQPAKGKSEARKTINVAMHEGQALAFAREHHAELAGLLESLKYTNRREYDRGIQELFRTSDRLAKLKEKSSDLYLAELKAWQLDSQIRLMQARMSMSEDPQLEVEIRDLLKQRVALRLSRLRDDRAKAERTLQQLDRRIGEAEKSLSVEGLDGELAKLKRELAVNRERKRLNKGAAQKKVEKNVPKSTDKPADKTAVKPNTEKPKSEKDKSETSKTGASTSTS